GHLAGGGADAAVVEGDDVVVLRDGVDDARVPVVQRRGQVDEEDHRDTAPRAEFTVREGDAAGGDGPRRGLGVRGDDTLVRAVVGPHDGCSFRVLSVVRGAVLDLEVALFFLRHRFLLP